MRIAIACLLWLVLGGTGLALTPAPTKGFGLHAATPFAPCELDCPPGGSTPYEFDYVIAFTGLAPDVVAVDSRTWGEVKALFH